MKSTIIIFGIFSVLSYVSSEETRSEEASGNLRGSGDRNLLEGLEVFTGNSPLPNFAPPNFTPTEWLEQHNDRRKTFYEKHGKSDMPLEWSNDLTNSAQNYADRLITRNGCQISHGFQGDKYGGENLYANWGTCSGQDPDACQNYAASPQQVLTGWFDNEENASFFFKLHFIQVGWRGTNYVGCGQATKVFDNGNQFCAIHVCRYLAAGNCGINANNYIQRMLEDSPSCSGPQCPLDATC